MIIVLYFLLLLVLSMEDYKFHKVKQRYIAGVFFLGVFYRIISQDDRWVTVALTCLCFLVLCLLHYLVNSIGRKQGRNWVFGGADVRLIPGMMLVQGWDVALYGIFFGFTALLLYRMLSGWKKQELALIPWMSAGCLGVALWQWFGFFFV